MPDVDFRQIFPKPPGIYPAPDQPNLPELIEISGATPQVAVSKKRLNGRIVWIYSALGIAALFGALPAILHFNPNTESFRAAARRSPKEFLYARPPSSEDNFRREKMGLATRERETSGSNLQLVQSTAAAEHLWRPDPSPTDLKSPQRPPTPTNINPLPQPTLNPGAAPRPNVADNNNRNAASQSASRGQSEAKSPDNNQSRKETKARADKNQQVCAETKTDKNGKAEKVTTHSRLSHSSQPTRGAVQTKSNLTDSLKRDTGTHMRDMANPRNNAAPHVFRSEMNSSGMRR